MGGSNPPLSAKNLQVVSTLHPNSHERLFCGFFLCPALTAGCPVQPMFLCSRFVIKQGMVFFMRVLARGGAGLRVATEHGVERLTRLPRALVGDLGDAVQHT